MFAFVCYSAALFVGVCIALIIGSICTVKDIKKPSDDPPCCGSCCPSGGPDGPQFYAYGRFLLDRQRPYSCAPFLSNERALSAADWCNRLPGYGESLTWVSRSVHDDFRYQLHDESIGTGCLV